MGLRKKMAVVFLDRLSSNNRQRQLKKRGLIISHADRWLSL